MTSNRFCVLLYSTLLFVLFAIPLIGIRGYLYGLLLSEILLSIMHIYSLYHIKS